MFFYTYINKEVLKVPINILVVVHIAAVVPGAMLPVGNRPFVHFDFQNVLTQPNL